MEPLSYLSLTRRRCRWVISWRSSRVSRQSPSSSRRTSKLTALLLFLQLIRTLKFSIYRVRMEIFDLPTPRRRSTQLFETTFRLPSLGRATHSVGFPFRVLSYPPTRYQAKPDPSFLSSRSRTRRGQSLDRRFSFANFFAQRSVREPLRRPSRLEDVHSTSSDRRGTTW